MQRTNYQLPRAARHSSPARVLPHSPNTPHCSNTLTSTPSPSLALHRNPPAHPAPDTPSTLPPQFLLTRHRRAQHALWRNAVSSSDYSKSAASQDELGMEANANTDSMAVVWWLQSWYKDTCKREYSGTAIALANSSCTDLLFTTAGVCLQL